MRLRTRTHTRDGRPWQVLALTNMGVCLLYGIGGAHQNFSAAVDLFHKAAGMAVGVVLWAGFTAIPFALAFSFGPTSLESDGHSSRCVIGAAFCFYVVFFFFLSFPSACFVQILMRRLLTLFISCF